MHAVIVDCEYGEDVRSIWLAEYVRWCQAFADYNTRYKKWTCIKVKLGLVALSVVNDSSL